jgi:ACS family D-galactonate transporter-like MFS transporter
MSIVAQSPAATLNGENPAVRWTIIGLLSVGMIVAYASRSNLSVALVDPDFIKSFGLSNTDRGVLNSAFFWAYAVLQIPAGWVVDRYGVKWPYALSFLFWCLAAAATSLAGTIGVLIALRVILGVGESVVAPASYKWIRMNFDERRRGLAVGLYMTGTKIGPAIGTPLAAWLIAIYDWRMMFVLIGLGGLVWLGPWLWLVKEDRTPATQAAAKKAAGPEIPFGRIMASPVIWGTIVASFCYMYFVYFCMTWMPAYLTEARHLSLTKMGLYTFFSFGGMAIVAALAGWGADALIGKGYNAVTVRKWFTIAGFTIACTELLGARATSVDAALFFAVVSLSGLGLATANYWALTQTLVPASSIGRVSGIQNAACSFSGIAAPIISGWLLEKTGSYEAPMMAVLVALVVGVLCYLFLIKEEYAPKIREA